MLKRYTVGFYGIRWRSGRDFPVPFSTLTRVQSPAVEESLLSGLVLREVRVLLGPQRVQVSEPASGRGEWGGGNRALGTRTKGQFGKISGIFQSHKILVFGWKAFHNGLAT